MALSLHFSYPGNVLERPTLCIPQDFHESFDGIPLFSSLFHHARSAIIVLTVLILGESSEPTTKQFDGIALIFFGREGVYTIFQMFTFANTSSAFAP